MDAITGYRTLYLVRHGQYDTHNPHDDGGSLTELGRQQSMTTGKYFRDMDIDAVHCSTMTRAIETAQLICATGSIHIDEQKSDLLREVIPTIPPRYAAHFFKRMERDPDFTHESVHDDQQRADTAFEEYFVSPPELTNVNELLVCHGNIIRYLVCNALGINVDTWAKLEIFHCGITVVQINEQGQMSLVSHNETGHLTSDLISM